MQPKLTDLIIASFSFEQYNPHHLKVLLLNAIICITILVSTLFFLINLFIAKNHSLATIDLLIISAMLYTLYLLRNRNAYMVAGYIGVVTLFILYIGIIFIQKGDHFTLIWSYFFSPFTMIALGAKRGLVVTTMFLVIMFFMGFNGIGIWDHGYWDTLSLIRFSLAHIAMLYMMYVIFYSQEKATEKIEFLYTQGQHKLKHYENLSFTDPLTGLYNRRYLHEIFPQHFMRAKKYQHTLAFFLLDIDYFKQYNDTYGHKQGDDLLIQIAQILKQYLNSETRYAFRIGGDEFAGIIIAETQDDIKRIIATIQHKVSQLQIDRCGTLDTPLTTTSIGVYIPSQVEYDFNTIYDMADRALYQAKVRGRDRTVVID